MKCRSISVYSFSFFYETRRPSRRNEKHAPAHIRAKEIAIYRTLNLARQCISQALYSKSCIAILEFTSTSSASATVLLPYRERVLQKKLPFQRYPTPLDLRRRLLLRIRNSSRVSACDSWLQTGFFHLIWKIICCFNCRFLTYKQTYFLLTWKSAMHFNFLCN